MDKEDALRAAIEIAKARMGASIATMNASNIIEDAYDKMENNTTNQNKYLYGTHMYGLSKRRKYRGCHSNPERTLSLC